MARFMGGDFGEKRPETEMTEEYKTWYEPFMHEQWLEYRKLDPADPLYPRGLGEAIGFGGYPFSNLPGPIKVRILKLPDATLPDFLGPIYVSDRVKTKIEEMEPGVHQFFPMEVIMPDGSPCPKQYWVWSNMNRVDALVLDKSAYMYEYHFNKEKWPGYSEYAELGGGPPTLALNKEKIAGKVKWLDYKLGKIFFSDEFAAWLDAEGIKGWESSDGRYYKVIEV